MTETPTTAGHRSTRTSGQAATPAETLQQALAVARSGDLAEARTLAETARAAGANSIAVSAFLGMLSAQEQDHDTAIHHLRCAHEGRPSDVTIACNLIATLIEADDLAGALAVATRGLARADTSLRVARYRGFLAQSLARFDDAIDAYETVVKQAPDDFESWNNLGNARQAVQDHDGAIAALERAVALEPAAPPARINLAAALTAADRRDAAEQILRTAADDFPQDARPCTALHTHYKQAGRPADALAALEQAVARDPEDSDLHFKLGVEYGLMMRTDAAEQSYRKALAIDPAMADAYLALAIHYEHGNRAAAFAPLIAEAERHGVTESGVLAFLRALDHRRAGRFAETLACLDDVPATMEPERTMHLRATVLDRLGETDKAFAAFADTARLHQAHPTAPLARAADYRERLREEISDLTPEWAASWHPDQPTARRPAPVFLVGFPRSGTTLLDTILMGHPDVTVLEEQPPLNHVDDAIGGFSAIATLEGQAIDDARAQYFAEVEGLLAPESNTGATGLLIDKSPLYLHKLPLVQRLFPDARFILAMRHPCDVLLSCYMSNFRLNAAMANFLRLEDAAALYDLTFRHWEQARALWPIRCHMVRYEALVADVENTVRPLFDFLDLAWDPKALDHQHTAQQRGLITTASYAQVTEPIYTRASGRWTRYRDQLEPILPVLEPWVARYGYTL